MQYKVIKDNSYILLQTRKAGDIVKLSFSEYQYYKDIVEPIDEVSDTKHRHTEPRPGVVDIANDEGTDSKPINNNLNKKKEKLNG